MARHKKPSNTSSRSLQAQTLTLTLLSLPTSDTLIFLTELREDIRQRLAQHSPQQYHAILTLSLPVRLNLEENELSKQSPQP